MSLTTAASSSWPMAASPTDGPARNHSPSAIRSGFPRPGWTSEIGGPGGPELVSVTAIGSNYTGTIVHILGQEGA
ncbi:MAG: hypothetical protein L0I76_29760 [Pseudonocardia sp.]|nr:hypothetical protein [Pseudonocardia sp.]